MVHPPRTDPGRLPPEPGAGGSDSFFHPGARDLKRAAFPPIPALGFGDREAWSGLLSRAGFHHARLDREIVTTTFPSVGDFLKALQATGATNPRPAPFAPRLLRALIAAYQDHYGKGGAIPASYEMIWAVAQK